jgi:hypothetical protein
MSAGRRRMAMMTSGPDQAILTEVLGVDGSIQIR